MNTKTPSNLLLPQHNIGTLIIYLIALILFSFSTLSLSNEVINPQVLIEGFTAEQVKAKIIERALARNLSLDNESQSKVTVSYEFSGKGRGSRMLRLGVDTVRDEIVYILVPSNENVKVYARLFISGINARGETLRQQLAADDSTEVFGGNTFGEQLQRELNGLKESMNK